MNVLPSTGGLFATNQVSPDTERCYGYQLRGFVQWMCESCGIEDMEDVTTADLLAYRQSLQHLDRSSQKRCLTAIKLFVVWALYSGIISVYPAVSLKLPRVVSNKASVLLTLDEMRRLLNTAKLPRDVALSWCLAYGLRIAEAID